MGSYQNTKGTEALLLPIQILEQERNPFDSPRMNSAPVLDLLRFSWVNPSRARML